jgi:hypothetical protein
MIFPSIDIQGSIISSDLLSKIRSEQASFQQGKDFIKDFTNARLKDEISSAWQDAKGQWTIFQHKVSRLKEGEAGTTETRNFWIVPLLTSLGYNLNFNRQSEEFSGKAFTIAYRDSQIDGFPVYVGGFNESLDKRPENKQLRVSPHAMVQEYLNYSEHLYGLVTNGRQLRLLRDASRITRLSYVEFNLQKMMEEDLYSDFVLLYRLLHVSRMPQKIDGGAESIIEKFHQEGLAAGSTIRNKLGNAVKETIKTLANGFINHPDNAELRTIVQNSELNLAEYYRQQLRIIYRLLFLFVIEERNLVYAESKTPETRRFSGIYFKYYSLLRLRKLAKKILHPDAHRHYDLWQSLLSTFALFEKNEIGVKLGIMSLQGDLFGPDSIATTRYDLHDCHLSNAIVLQVIKALSYFENEAGVQMAVNYGGLDVEEFGSVYEGLLELKLKIEPVAGTEIFSCSFAGSEERSKSGSHYTPDELVQPLIKHSLDYLLEDRKKIINDFTSKQKLTGPAFRTKREELVKEHIYSLKVCDVACGSGHLLISGARRIAEMAACIIEEEEQPNPKAFQSAKRNAILNCIYGVDKNPLAVELCKVALWLEAYVPGQPLNFLDHHIKCGDAIVGLAHRDELENGIVDEAYKTLPGDDKDVAKTFRDKNAKERKERTANATQLKAEFEKTTENSVHEAMAEYKSFNQLSETTPEEIERKAKAYRRFMAGKGFSFLKAMADTQVAQFFIPKIIANKDYLMTDADFRQILSGYKGWQDRKVGMANTLAQSNRFFHWFLEFPEVFNEGGFDCVLGNPPFLGGLRISTHYDSDFLNYLHASYFPTGGTADLVAYFFRRIFSIIKEKCFQSLISTNSISQGDTREGSLDIILKEKGEINFAIRSIRWPGLAAVNVSLITIHKGKWNGKFVLDGKQVKKISNYLDDVESIAEKNSLKQNEGKSFIGALINGLGFILDSNEYKSLKAFPELESVIFQFLGGDEFNTSFDETPQNWIINFGEFDELQARKFTQCFNIIEQKVKPERQKKKGKLKEKWWQYERPRPDLYKTIRGKERILVTARISKYQNFLFKDPITIFNEKIVATAYDKNSIVSILNSSIHNVWCWKYSSTLGAGTLIYSPTDCLETFSFPQNLSIFHEQQLEKIGKEYHDQRRQQLLSTHLGLTKTYNAFHAKEIQSGITTAALQTLNKQSIEKQYGKEVWNLWNHLQKTPGTCSIEEAIAGIIKLRELHVEMDEAVLEAYGWCFDSAGFDSAQPPQLPAIELRHDFYEVDYLPENDRVRFTIHPEARKEILKRLLELNHKIHQEEVEAGLWDKKKVGSKKVMGGEVGEKEVGYGGLFD